MFGIKPDIGHFRVFGSDGYAYVDESKRNKLQKKAYASLFLGYTNNSKGYSVYNKESGKVDIIRTVQSSESIQVKYAEVSDGNIKAHANYHDMESEDNQDDESPGQFPADRVGDVEDISIDVGEDERNPVRANNHSMTQYDDSWMAIVDFREC